MIEFDVKVRYEPALFNYLWSRFDLPIKTISTTDTYRIKINGDELTMDQEKALEDGIRAYYEDCVLAVEDIEILRVG